jgi:hypothetical protein
MMLKHHMWALVPALLAGLLFWRDAFAQAGEFVPVPIGNIPVDISSGTLRPPTPRRPPPPPT